MVVEDDAPLRDGLIYNLRSRGYEVCWAGDGASAIEIARTNMPDLILLDVMLPELDGYQVCRILRQEMSCPILMLTAKVEEIDRVLGLEIGADDYITKPFNPRELTIRARNLLQRTMAEKEHHTHHSHVDRYQFNGWTLDLNSRSLINPEGELIKLPRSEFRALLHFCENPGKIQTREDLLKRMTGRELKPHDRTVDVTIRRIRKHFEDHPNTPEIIVTIHGEGYRFCGTFE